MKLTSEQMKIVKRLLKAETDDFVALSKIAGLDPKRDCRNANLREINFGKADLSGWDFSGADLRRADFRNASCVTSNAGPHGGA